ncbi:MAG: hypothetical protein WAW17_03965, partial [Rhodococcus sp. (in: high G+C Gram-positive bacteria)]|uniref:hypothetical protein n=1 Tax=Rhodococcus sp. TaxID=1831 RepID=UPI003BB0486F
MVGGFPAGGVDRAAGVARVVDRAAGVARVFFPAVPADLVALSAVEAVVAARESGERAVDESYLETAHYAARNVLEVAGEEEDLDLDGYDAAAVAARERQIDAVQEAFDLGIIPEVEDWEARAHG